MVSRLCLASLALPLFLFFFLNLAFLSRALDQRPPFCWHPYLMIISFMIEIL